jgi:hypothetical protein
VYVEQLPRVFNFFRYRCGNVADAEDLTSITFEKAWRGRERYRRDKGASPPGCSRLRAIRQWTHYRARTPVVPLDEAALVATLAAPGGSDREPFGCGAAGGAAADAVGPRSRSDRAQLRRRDEQPRHRERDGLSESNVGHRFFTAPSRRCGRDGNDFRTEPRRAFAAKPDPEFAERLHARCGGSRWDAPARRALRWPGSRPVWPWRPESALR